MRIGLTRAPWVALCLLALGAAGCGEKSEDLATNPPEPPGFEIEGRWSGELHQKALETFRVDADIGSLENPKRNTVHYSGIDCAGNWTFQGREGIAYVFHEVIDRGAGRECKDAGTVTLTPFSTDGVDYDFRGGGIESAGVLARGGAKPSQDEKSKPKHDGNKKAKSDGSKGKNGSGSGKPTKKDIGVQSDSEIPDQSCSYTGDC
jgi:hypothetical protein